MDVWLMVEEFCVTITFCNELRLLAWNNVHRQRLLWLCLCWVLSQGMVVKCRVWFSLSFPLIN
jgi:hypothetical protein